MDFYSGHVVKITLREKEVQGFEKLEMIFDKSAHFLDQREKKINSGDWPELKVYDSFLSEVQKVFESLLKISSLADFNRELKLSLIDFDWLDSIFLLHEEELLVSYENFAQGDIFYFERSNGPFYLHLKINSDLDYSVCAIVALIFDLVESFLNKLELEQWDSGSDNIWVKSFMNLPRPVALISEAGDLLLHNQLFSQMEIFPTNCLKLSHKEQVELCGIMYIVHHKEVIINNKKNHYYVFVSEEKNENSSKSFMGNVEKRSSEELGIISSSVAHELNNPLAGILAAINLLELEEELSDESRTSLEEMKKSASRCKELVEIFLGFSRATTDKKLGTIAETINQSLNLLRFRMIESNLRIEISTNKNKELFGQDINVSILTIVFYLLLNEIITACSHQRLIANEDVAKCIEVQFIERFDFFEIRYSAELEMDKALAKMRLLQHLIDLENLTLEIEQGSIKFSKWMLT